MSKTLEVIISQSFACTPKLLETRLESDITCIASALNTILNSLFQSQNQIAIQKAENSFILTTCLNSLHYYDPNEASKYDIFIKLGSSSDNVDDLKKYINEKATGIYNQ